MTQVCPVFGVSPVPTFESVICSPEAVVMVFPAVWAEAGVKEPEARIRLNPAISANAKASAREKNRIPVSLMKQVARMSQRVGAKRRPMTGYAKSGVKQKAAKTPHFAALMRASCFSRHPESP